MKLGPRRVGESYAEDMRETRFPIHVPENVPGTKVQEHDWEIAGASVSSVSRPCGRQLCSRVCPRSLGRVAVGFWPYGLWTLAAWRCLICARKPVPQWCPMVVNPCGDARPTMGFSLIGALPGLDQRRQGGRECAVRFWIQLGWGWG